MIVNFSPDVVNTGVSLLHQITPLARQINCLDIDLIGKICVETIPQMVGAKYASIYILDETSSILHLISNNHPFLINKIVSLNQNPPSPMVMAIRSKQLLTIADFNEQHKLIIRKSQRAFADNYQTDSCIIAPLLCQERVIGVMNLTDKVSGFSSEDLALVELFSQLIGASIGNIKLFERIQRQATCDGLTGLSNHKTFYEVLERELWRIKRYGGNIALVMIDVDGLKTINDKYGHRVGDKAISHVSRKIKECIRQVDTAARYGGDEFAVILPNTLLPDATNVAKRMVNAVAESPIEHQGMLIPISVSIGLGEYDSDTSPEDITSCSDMALYTAKREGKNTVRIYQQ